MSTESFQDVLTRLADGSQTASAEVFERYARRIIGLARAQLGDRLKGKEDPDDIAQSVFRSFFVRQRDGKFDLESWDGLWALLATITARKCGRKLEFWTAQQRDIRRETPASPRPEDEQGAEQPDIADAGAEDAEVVADLVESLLSPLSDVDRRIIEMRLSGHTTIEISQQVKRSERTVIRRINVAKDWLEKELRN